MRVRFAVLGILVAALAGYALSAQAGPGSSTPGSAVDYTGRSKKVIRAPYFVGTQDPTGAVTITNAPLVSPYGIGARNFYSTDPASWTTLLGPAYVSTLTGTVAGDVSPAGVKASDSTTSRTNAARWADFVNVLDFGAACDGTTNDTAAFTAAIAAAMTLGKELRLPAATCKTTGQITLPNNGATPPRQKPLRIVGSGATMSGRGASAANGGSVWDATYAGTLYGKILTTGLGVLEVSGVTFTDSGGGTLPWLYTTNTTLKIHEVAFIGSNSGTSADQDAIVLGGVQPVEGLGDPEHGFQGYGTVIRDNHFHRIRRAVYGRTYANAVVVRDNTVWSNCGSNLADGAAIEFDSVGGGAATGNVITGNLIEVTGYPYAIKLGSATQNTITGNGLFDSSVTTLAGVRFESNATFNVLVDGFLPPGVTPLSDATTGGALNTHLAIGQAQDIRIGQGGLVHLNASDIVWRSGGSMPLGHFYNDTLMTETYAKLGGTAANPTFDVYLAPTGASPSVVGSFRYYGSGQSALQLPGATFAAVETPGGDLKLRVKTGNTLWLGDLGGTSCYWQQSTKTLNLTGADNRINVAGTGAEFTLGATTFATLPASNPGSLRYCSDCSVANPCAGGGTGAIAKRLNGAWVCN